MNEERMKILEMLADGIITSSEANELLATLDKNKVEVATENGMKSMKVDSAIKSQLGKTLHVKVLSKDVDKVNINLPIALIKATIKAGNMSGLMENSLKINIGNSEFLKDNVNLDFILECIESGAIGKIVDVESKEGDKVEIYID